MLFNIVDARILLYNTEDNRNTEYYDCIYYTTDATIKYCRHYDEERSLIRSQSNCDNGGEKYFFKQLLDSNITPSETLDWNTSIEQVDAYARFYYASLNKTNLTETDYLCKCTKKGTFGKFCEYMFTDESESFEQAITAQFIQKRENPWNAQLYGSILCYKTLLCDSGLLCLDWRNICDGQQHCTDGKDEENCDMLEFNECEDNEYRCANGMCIAEEYWLDGK